VEVGKGKKEGVKASKGKKRGSSIIAASGLKKEGGSGEELPGSHEGRRGKRKKKFTPTSVLAGFARKEKGKEKKKTPKSLRRRRKGKRKEIHLSQRI